jgi:flagellar protein FlgJ
MISKPDISAARFALDMKGVDDLRLQARADSKQALKKVAQEFEALFLHMMLKSMREATPQDGPFDSEHSRMYLDLLDQQLSQKIASGRGVGLADALVKQLSGTQGAAAPAGPATTEVSPGPVGGAAALEELRDLSASQPARSSAPADFVNKLWPHAVEAGQSLGVPPRFLVAQAALETGWGRNEIRNADGSSSHNLFGIKAGADWTGPVAEAMTTEYVNGVPRKRVDRFRAYASYREAFRDYADLLRGNPRYREVLNRGEDAAGFATGLQQAGYATDPLYADKIQRILNGETLRQALLA